MRVLSRGSELNLIASAGQGPSRTGKEGRDCGWSSLTPEEVPTEGDDRVTVCRRLVLPPTQELHLVSVVLPQVRNVEDPDGLGVLHHHHVALRVVGHTPLLASRVNERPNSFGLTQLVVEPNGFFGLLHMHRDVLIL